MLGVDCFSRAGWKEFWLYLWNLNPDVFPLHTTTYPLTKGIKVELAGVVILCVFGIISQLRLWRLVKERRDEREEHEQQKAESQQLHEAELGRIIEDKFQRERREWEATYGEKALPGSSDESGSATPQSPSLDEKEPYEIAYDSKVDFEGSENKHTKITIAAVQDEEIQRIDAKGTPIAREGLVPQSADISRSNSTRPSSDAVAFSGSSRTVSVTSSLKPSSPPPPVVVPLPFKIPQEEDARSTISDNASVSALPDTEEEVLLADERYAFRHLPSKPTMKRMSTVRSSVDGFQSADALMMSQNEDDRRSSVAATLDDEDRLSLSELSPPASPVDAKFNIEDSITNKSSSKTINIGELREDSAVALGRDAATPSTPTIDVPTAEALKDEYIAHEKAPSPSQIGIRQFLTVSTDPKHDAVQSKLNSPRSPRLRHDTLVKEGSDKSSSAKSDAPGSVIDDFSNAPAVRLSKVAQSYRTNEWAKHLEAADKPEVDEVSEPSSPGAQLDHEQPAPVSEGIAQPFAVAKRASKRVSSDSNVHRKNAFMQINSNSARQSQSELPAMASLHMSTSQQPLTANLVGRRVSSGPAQPPSKTLMGKRESLMRNRVSTQNFNQQSSSVNNLTATAEDDMTLAQRRHVLKQQKPPSASQKWQKGSWAASPQAEGFDSHQPKRTVGSGSDQKREELLVGWRGSVQQNGVPMQGAVAKEEQQRAAMMNAKRQKEMEQQQQAAIAQHRESMRHNMMRSSEMLDAHRDAMRRMQASANRRA
ncbi:hypothetical protein SLS60_003376 [Paraconiothyrium brasiliense]|uniref:TM7S3/TM198-like domain-containing protein n=1 Tax=Paraconiothyrium brasiliense TaxID=300254 RepID=A0ABR3RVH5_9PLEO